MSTQLRCFIALLPIAWLAFAVAGCAPASLSSARVKMAAGQFEAAHQELAAIDLTQLSASQRREVKDDLCQIDVMIGAPAYSLSQQRRVCADAAQEPGSLSARYVAQIDTTIRTTASNRVTNALDRGDLAEAEQAATLYISTPGADPALADKWSREMWELVRARDEQGSSHSKKQVAAAIAELRKQNAPMKKLSKAEFMSWITKQGTVNGVPMFSSVALKDQELDLSVRSGALRSAALQLDRFSAINDAAIARCNCDGKTNVAIAETNFPLYVVRLDPETRQSEVLILPHQP